MKENWQHLGEVTRRVTNHLAPVSYIVPLQGALAVELSAYAIREGQKPETIIAEAVRSYLGDAA